MRNQHTTKGETNCECKTSKNLGEIRWKQDDQNYVRYRVESSFAISEENEAKCSHSNGIQTFDVLLGDLSIKNENKSIICT